MDKKLTEQDYLQTAERLDCEVAVIRAIDLVESSGSGFLNDGRPKILFEAHIFHRLTKGLWDAKYPEVSNKQWDKKLYKGGSKEYDRLAIALKLDRPAALMSTSWGKYQILGQNYKLCGYDNIDGFVDDMYKSEVYHLNAFVKFIKSNGKLWEALKTKNWEAFAKYYNGPSYQKNRYPERLENAYKKYFNQ